MKSSSCFPGSSVAQKPSRALSRAARPRAYLTLCLGLSLAFSAWILSFSLPGKQEAFEVAEGELIPYRGPGGLPAKIGFMQLIFTLIHLSTGSPSPHPPFWFFSVSEFMYCFFPPLSVSFFVNLSWQVIMIIATSISRTYGPSSKRAAPALNVSRSSKKMARLYYVLLTLYI